MARKGIREYDAKRMLATALTGYDGRVVLVSPGEKLEDKVEEYPWLKTEKLVAKPDQLFGKRGKNDLLSLNKDLAGTSAWIQEKMNSEKTLLSGVTGTLTHFLVEPFTPINGEYYLSLDMDADCDYLRISNAGGVEVEENWDQVVEIKIDPLEEFTSAKAKEQVASLYPAEEQEAVLKFIDEIYAHYVAGNYTYLEINPFTIVDGAAKPLDTVAKVDDTAAFESRQLWGNLDYPAAFGQALTDEEAFVREVDSKTGASLKLTILNPEGRVWNLVAGGGASVVYADTVCDMGLAKELAMYGEYSGNPNTQNTYLYTKTILGVMTRNKAADGKPKYLLVGGGIANFTDVAKTFTGIIMAIEEYADKLKEVDARIFVRRGGPNYQQGLANLKNAAERLGLPIMVGGPEMHMTKIVEEVTKES